MYLFGHLGLASLVYAPVGVVLLARSRERLAVAGGAVTVGLTTLPDVDVWLPFVAHRGLTHTVWFALAVGLAASAVGVASGRRRGRAAALRRGAWAAGFGALSVLAHLAGDVMTPMGIRPFAPVDAHYTFHVVYSRNPGANHSVFAAGALAVAVTWNAAMIVRRDPVPRSAVATAESVATAALSDAFAPFAAPVDDPDDGRPAASAPDGD